MVGVKIYCKKGARLPEKSTSGSACYDVRAFLPPDQEIILEPGDRFAVPTGLYFSIPEGYFLSVRPRSGLANDFGVTVLNSPGTVDSDYRGELKILLINLGEKTFRIRNNDKIAQILLEREIPVSWDVVDTKEELGITERGEGGFGSTGIA